MTETGAPAALAALLELQAVDVRADQLRYQLAHHPARLALDEHAAEERAAQRRAEPIVSEQRGLAQRQDELEREIAETNKRISAIDGRLRSASAGSFRDQEAMAQEIASLARRRTQLEDDELEVMEAKEPLDVELASLAEADARRAGDVAARREELAAATAELNGQLAATEARRGEVATRVDPRLLEEYERLRTRLGGIGVAHVEHGMCSGCNLALSAGERDRIAHAAPGALFHCEQCGRILVDA